MSDRHFVRRAMLTAIVSLGLVLGFIWLWHHDDVKKDRPKLALITSLPMVWREGDLGDNIRDKREVDPAYTALSRHFDIRPLDSASDLSQQGYKLALLAQPRAMSPRELVALDAWIRAGGRALILADPVLSRESEYPLGDPRRPLFTSLLSPLFTHWGIELILPVEERDAVTPVEMDTLDITLSATGAWRLVDKSDGVECSLGKAQLTADCKVGKGRAFLLADADILDPSLVEPTLFGGNANIEWVMDKLDILFAG